MIRNFTSLCPLLLLLLHLPLALPTVAQPVHGLRHVERISQGNDPIAYTQIWDITAGEGADEHVFFATNDGLCSYDGVRWESSKPEGNPVIRALRYDASSGRLYSAGVNEFGYWLRDDYGRFVYKALYKNPVFRYQSNDFWRIAVQGLTGKVFFQCREKICIYDTVSGTIRELLPESTFRYMYEVGRQIYFQDGVTLYRLGDDLNRERICDFSSRVINLVTGRHGELIAAVEHVGLLEVCENGIAKPLDPAANAQLAEAKITCCRRYNDDLLLVGTTRRGLFLINNDGSISHVISYGPQLDNTTILSVAPDRRGNIWLGLDSGVASIDNSTQDYYLTDVRLGQVHSILGWPDGRILVGSNKGLFVLNGAGEPTLVEGSTGCVWELEQIDGRVYMLHDQGLFRLSDQLRLVPVVTGSGVHSLSQCSADRRYYIMGTYSGISLLRHGGEGLQFVSRIDNYNGFTRDIHVDQQDRVWVTVLGVGFVRLTLSDDKLSVVSVRNFDLSDTAEGNVFASVIDQELTFCCDGRAYRIDYSAHAADSLVRAPAAERILALCGSGVKNLSQSGNRVWYVAADGVGYVERSGTSLVRYAGVLEQAVRERISTKFRQVGEAAVVGFRNGIGFSFGGDNTLQSVGIGMVTAQGPNQTIYHNLRNEVFEIPAAMNTLRIYPVHLPAGHLVEYRIASLGQDWQIVRVDNFLQVPALPHGRHTVELRAPGSTDKSTWRRIVVQVLPPWYIAWPMIVVYVLIVAGLLAVVRGYYVRKNRRAQEELRRREKERREKALGELERENLLKEKRISELEREKLKSDLRNKDKRLANITMNTIRRNNMLNDLKTEVSELTATESMGRIKTITGRVLRQINTQLNDDTDWKQSEGYFNTIYDGLLDRLRVQYPLLSQTDLRMCVYIKLNLTTKETAELMNISPRSVEMARYRLRKKLGLGPNDNIGSILQ